MIRLIKAEWYKLIHTGVLKYFVLACFIFPVMTMLTDLDWYKMTISENMILFSQNAAIMMPMLLSVIISIPIGQAFQNKIAYYEIMDGRKKYQILLSKVVLYTSIFVVGITVICGVYFLVLGIINGMGDMSNIPLRFILTEIVIIRVCIASTLICMLVKNIIGIGIVIVRFMFFDSLSVTFITFSFSDPDSSFVTTNSQSGADWFITGQITKIFSADVDSRLALIIIITLVFEVALWYILAYISYKHKKF